MSTGFLMILLMKKEHRIRFAAILGEWMDKNGYSQRRAAKELDCSATAVRSWMETEAAPGFEHIEKVAERIGMTVEGLVAEIRGVNLSSLPRDLSVLDMERLALGLSSEDRQRLLIKLAQSNLTEEKPAPEKKKTIREELNS